MSIKFNQTGGFPLTTNVLGEMQTNYELYNSYGYTAGNYTIISGCKEIGNTVENGTVFINGELLPFKGGTKISKCRIREVAEKSAFQNGDKKDVFLRRFVEFGTGINAFEYSKLKRLDTLLIIMERLKALENAPKFVKGMILIWGKPANEIPAGFIPYTGLAGLVPVGVDKNYSFSNNSDLKNYRLDTVGEIGGKREHSLTENELPVIQPKFKQQKGVRADLDSGRDATLYSDGTSHKNVVNINQNIVSPFGGGKPHTNMQPYRVVEFIQFVGLFKISIKSVTNTQITFFCEKTDTVLEIKNRYSEETNIHIDDMKFIYNNKELANDKTLENYNIAYNGILHFILK